ncbi:DUF397 domain-containing protein [Streptomyces cyaneofuscatus]
MTNTNSNPKAVTRAAGAVWLKSSYSSGAEGNCVEVADLEGQVGIRDSKRPVGPALVVASAAFSSFIDSVR